MVDERHEGPLGHNEGGFPTGRGDKGWQQPGAAPAPSAPAASAPPHGGFGQEMAPPSGPAIGGPSIPPPPGMSPMGPPPPGGAGFVVTGGPERSRSPWVVLGVIAALFVVLIGGCAALIAVGGTDASYDISPEEAYDDYLYDEYGDELYSDTVVPPVAIPPADAAAATGEIVELYDQVFTPAESPELWSTLFTDPDGLGPLGERLENSICAAGAQVVVTAVQFTSDDSAVVRFRFEGPNVPELGRNYTFDGGADRVPGEPWRATPDGVIAVVEASAGYC